MREPILLHEGLTRSAELHPEGVLISDGKRGWTYAEAATSVERLGRALRRLGVTRGDRVALLWRNSAEYVTAFYGILAAGAAAVPINHAVDARALAAQITDSGAVAAIVQGSFAKVFVAARAEGEDREQRVGGGWGRCRVVVTDDPAEWPGGLEGVELLGLADVRDAASQAATLAATGAAFIDLDLAAIIYTSGSTGRPRGVMLSHLNLVSNTRSILRYLELTDSDRTLAVLPFFYVYGQSMLNTHVWSGASLLIGSDLLFPNAVVRRLAESQVTGLSGVPSTFAILLHRSNLERTALPALRYVTQAGGAMAPEMIRRLVKAVPGARVFIMYGATEAGARLTYLDPDELPRKVGSVGKAISGVEILVLREDATPCGPGETGEIVARGANIMSGYWNAPEETSLVLSREGFHTGDLGYMDTDGFLYVVGRKREMIKCGANRISPIEVEEVLLEHAAVFEAAVFGVPDEVQGEAIVAYVALHGDATPGELCSHCARRLPEYKVPTAIEVVEAMPKSGAGKIDKGALRAAWSRKPRAAEGG